MARTKNKEKEKPIKSKKPPKIIRQIKALFTITLLLLVALVVGFFVWDSHVFTITFNYEGSKPFLETRMGIIDFPDDVTNYNKDNYTFYGWQDDITKDLYFESSILVTKAMTFNAIYIDETVFINDLELDGSLYEFTLNKTGQDLKQELLKPENIILANSNVHDRFLLEDNIYNNNLYLIDNLSSFVPYEQNDFDSLYKRISLFNDNNLSGLTSEQKALIKTARFQLFYINVNNEEVLNLPFGEDEGFYEPTDELKGVIARTILYMWLYYDAIDFSKTFNQDTDIISIETLLRWHFTYPVNDYEQSRIKSILSGVGGSNPFSEHKEFALYLFKEEIIKYDLMEIIS